MAIDRTSGHDRRLFISSMLHMNDLLLGGEADINERYPFRAGLVAEFGSALRAPQNLAHLRQIVHSFCTLDWNELTLARFVGEKITVPHNGANIALAPPCKTENSRLLRNQNSERIFLPGCADCAKPAAFNRKERTCGSGVSRPQNWVGCLNSARRTVKPGSNGRLRLPESGGISRQIGPKRMLHRFYFSFPHSASDCLWERA